MSTVLCIILEIFDSAHIMLCLKFIDRPVLQHTHSSVCVCWGGVGEGVVAISVGCKIRLFLLAKFKMFRFLVTQARLPQGKVQIVLIIGIININFSSYCLNHLTLLLMTRSSVASSATHVDDLCCLL